MGDQHKLYTRLYKIYAVSTFNAAVVSRISSNISRKDLRWATFSLSDFVLSSEVNTTHGRILGKTLKTIFKKIKYEAFMGIPFAAPPLKKLRFQPPQPIEPWSEVLPTQKIKPACVQSNNNFLKGQSLGQYGEENCLYLDIYTPAADDNKRAVIAFIYNDRFINSYNKTKDYAPDFFIEEDLVVVTISHRLSLFGFLSFEDEVLSGNAGLKDIVAGLEWVSNNINVFGGDSQKITLLGARGGAAAVDFLIRSKANSYFRSAILQSGTSLNSEYLQENVRQRAFKLGELLEIATSSSKHLLDELNKVPTKDLLLMELRASPDNYFKNNQRGVLTFSPIVEGSKGFITEYPGKEFEKINIPIMIGFNSREGLPASTNYLMQPHFLRYAQKDFPFLIPLRIKFKFDPTHNSYYDAVQDVKDFYFSEGKVTKESISQYIKYMSDLKAFPIHMTAKIYANLSSQVYYYHFDYLSDLNENRNNIVKMSLTNNGTFGASTGDELCYLFRCPSLNDKYIQHKHSQSKELRVQRKLIKMWSNFVKFGNPTPENDNPLKVNWPAHNLETKKYLHIDEKMTIKNNLLEKRFKFWENMIEKWEKIVNDLNKKDEL